MDAVVSRQGKRIAVVIEIYSTAQRMLDSGVSHGLKRVITGREGRHVRYSWNEAVSNTILGYEMARVICIRLKLLAQFYDVNIDGTRIRKRFISPNRVEEHIARQRAIRVLHKEAEEVVLCRGELQRLAVPGHYAAMKIDRD